MAEPNTTGMPRTTEVRSTTLVAPDCSTSVRSFKITTKDGEVLDETLPVGRPLTVADVDAIIATMSSTETPLQDLNAVVTEMRGICHSYEAIDGLTAVMKRAITIATRALNRARQLLDTAGSIRYNGLPSDVERVLARRECVNLAQDSFSDGYTALAHLVNLPALLSLGVTAAQRDAAGVTLARAVMVFNIWAEMFDCGLFA